MPAPLRYEDLPAHVRAKLGPNSPLLPGRGRRVEREHAEQVDVFRWADDPATRKTYPQLRWLFAIPNGGHRNKAVAGKLKAAGVRRGVPDLCLPVPRAGFHGCYVELKAEGGSATPEQRTWRADLLELGYQAVVAFGADECKRVLTEYLDRPPFGFDSPTTDF